MKKIYIICEKTYIDRLGEQIEDETNIGDSDTVKGLVEYLRSKNIKIAKSAIYKTINTKKPIYDRYFVYKIKI